jgi:hypothetical protein
MAVRHSSVQAVHAAALGILIGTACSDGGTPPAPVPTSVAVSPAAPTLAALGATQQLAATVRDQSGAAMSGVTVTWSSSDTTVVRVSLTGLVTAVANGSAQITAAAGAASGSATVTVAQVPSQVTVAGGTGQSGMVTTSLPDSLAFVVRDSRSNVIAGATMSFTVSTGGGTVSPPNAVTDAAGRSATRWTFGTQAGAHTITARVGSASAPTGATATADAADSMYVVAGNNQTGVVSAPLSTPLAVGVLDQYRNPVAGHPVRFEPDPGDGTVLPIVAPTSASGQAATTWTLGPTLGAQALQATAGGLKGEPLSFTATAGSAQPSSVEIYAGNAQVALATYPVNVPPAVLVRDALGNPFVGATVNFTVTAGGGSITGASATTNANGIAEVGSWTVNAGANGLSATVVGSGIANNPANFSATGASQQYDIELRYITTPDAQYESAFTVAVSRWELLIFGDVPAVQLTTSANQSCGGVTIAEALNETIDDLVIYVDLQPIDGQGNIIGSAGPCYVRSTSGIPLLGGMKFDTDDLDYLNTRNLLDETIVHEMGHVLGFGTLWAYSAIDLLRDPSDPADGGTPGADTYFAGTQARWSFDRIGGATYTGAKVPVENDNSSYGSGSLDSHWRETVFETELMTPTLNGGPGIDNLLSQVTAASMGDLGYTVNYAGAQSYVLPGPAAVAAAESGPRIDLGNDVARGPIYLVDRGGRVVGVMRR